MARVGDGHGRALGCRKWAWVLVDRQGGTPMAALVGPCLGLRSDLSWDSSLRWASAFLSGHWEGNEVASKALSALPVCGTWEAREGSPELPTALARKTDRSVPLSCMAKAMTAAIAKSAYWAWSPKPGSVLSPFCSLAPKHLQPPWSKTGKGPGQSCPLPCPHCPEQSLAGRDAEITFTEQ